MKNLEDENKMLDTKLKILKDHEDYSGKIDDLVRHLENELEEQIENLIRDQEKLQAELIKKKEEVEETKLKSVLIFACLTSSSMARVPNKMFCLPSSYEDELKKKADLENEFIMCKKVLEVFFPPAIFFLTIRCL